MPNRLFTWVSPPTFGEDTNKNLASQLLNFIIWILILFSSLYGLLAPIEAEFLIYRFLFIIPYVLAMLLAKQLLNRGYIQATGNFVVFSLWLVITIALLLGADYQNPAFMGYVVVVICAGLVLSRPAVIGWVVLSIVTSALILQLGLMGVLPSTRNTTPPFAFWVAQAAYIIISSIFLSQTLGKIEHARKKAQQELTERKRVEAEREKIILELEAKNAELERFTYTVSHDLKSPLITIGGFMGLLENDIRSGNIIQVQHDLKRIGEAKDKMQRLLNELLELSRIGRIINPPTEIPFIQLIEEALKLTKGYILERNIQIEMEHDFPNIYGDRQRLTEVLQNLIENAAKFTRNRPNPQIKIGMQRAGAPGTFYIQDNGIGIDSLFHERIFGLFDKLDPKSEGTGVGLALAKRIIEIHGGKIWVESLGDDQGSTFYFTLPLKPG